MIIFFFLNNDAQIEKKIIIIKTHCKTDNLYENNFVIIIIFLCMLFMLKKIFLFFIVNIINHNIKSKYTEKVILVKSMECCIHFIMIMKS